MRNYLRLLLLVTGLWFSAASAQTDMTLYNMRFVPQAMYTNPANLPMSNVNIGLPVISSLYFNIFNSGFSYKNLVRLDGDSLTLDANNLISKLGKKNLFGVHTNIDLLSFSFRVKKNFFSFNATNKFYTRFGYPRDFISLLWNGNGAFLGKRADMDGFGINAALYNELGFGYAREINEKLTVGGKLKLLNGTVGIYTKRNNLGLTTNSENFTLDMDADYSIYFNGPFMKSDSGLGIAFDSTFTDNPSNFFMGRNLGFGLDLGAAYQINDKFRVSASILDLGFIRFTDHSFNMKVDKTSFTFEGVDVKELLPGQDSTKNYGDVLSNTMDSLQNKFKPAVTEQKFNNPLITRFYLAGNYALNENNDVGLLFHGEVFRGSFRPAIAASINSRVGRVLSTSLTWSYVNRSAANIGLGVSLNLGPLQWYGAIDNILAPFIPYATRNVHAHIGFNLTFGRAKKDRDRDGIVDKEDECPELPGLAELAGCPDRDGDKIIDPQDACPDVPGVPEFNGCPDTDKDGVTDTLDACVDVPGDKELNGCPDRDKDKIIDKEDNCPDQPGPKATRGCPDKDNDGVIDMEDLCPEKPGAAEHKGCPDTDGDGVFDNEDRCVDVAGPVENGGCPWGDADKDGVIDREDRCPDTAGPADNQGCPYGDMDGDGVVDKDDECPKTPGPAENKGCPVIDKAAEEILKTAFDNLEFESGKAVIKQSSYASLDSLAALLVRKPEWKLQIAGHTDNVGQRTANMTLSKNRSEAVRDYLNQRGVSPMERFIVQWYGPDKPLVPNTTPENKQRNRRVEMTVKFE